MNRPRPSSDVPSRRARSCQALRGTNSKCLSRLFGRAPSTEQFSHRVYQTPDKHLHSTCPDFRQMKGLEDKNVKMICMVQIMVCAQQVSNHTTRRQQRTGRQLRRTLIQREGKEITRGGRHCHSLSLQLYLAAFLQGSRQSRQSSRLT